MSRNHTRPVKKRKVNENALTVYYREVKPRYFEDLLEEKKVPEERSTSVDRAVRRFIKQYYTQRYRHNDQLWRREKGRTRRPKGVRGGATKKRKRYVRPISIALSL